jgi:hypothetical protein
MAWLLAIICTAFILLSSSTVHASHGLTSSSNSSLLNVINQSQNGPENVNVTSNDRAVYNQTNGTSDNQTMQAVSGINGTSTNGTTAETVTNAL